MSVVKALSFIDSVGKCSISIEYSDIDQSLTKIVWSNLSELSAKIEIWSYSVLIYKTIVIPKMVGEDDFPTGYSVIQKSDALGTYWDLPDGMIYKAESIQ